MLHRYTQSLVWRHREFRVQREIGDLSEDEIKERCRIEYCWLELGHLLLSENDLITSSIVIANHRLQAYTDRT